MLYVGLFTSLRYFFLSAIRGVAIRDRWRWRGALIRRFFVSAKLTSVLQMTVKNRTFESSTLAMSAQESEIRNAVDAEVTPIFVKDFHPSFVVVCPHRTLFLVFPCISSLFLLPFSNIHRMPMSHCRITPSNPSTRAEPSFLPTSLMCCLDKGCTSMLWV
ncbi:hypothetical protein SCHPADRAFT_245155 [Schizopora paradoxa]|uniref:Uncharacterized protein n=1 Tax=Schizopora paradoxa TaxID=27342 RepID=A0A0H2SFH6_9AGAM|nr:hypothetical protein SCHPADRAFT_245155 [Schizopora paradoxa]